MINYFAFVAGNLRFLMFGLILVVFFYESLGTGEAVQPATYIDTIKYINT